MMEITFMGAAGNVTGSRFLLWTGKDCLLIDCGLFQERDFRTRNWEPFPVKPSEITAVLITHAHLDHCGFLPKLIKEGFKGKIYATAPTVDIARIALIDSGKINQEDAAYKRRRHKKENRKGPHPELPLYTVEDAEAVMGRFHPGGYGEKISVTPSCTAVFHNAGHIIGSAMIELKIKEGGKRKRLIFTGDIGRRGNILLNQPSRFKQADGVIMESTYGDRVHESQTEALVRLEKIISETYRKGGNLVIPTFAIERSQELIFHIGRFIREQKIPPMKVFIDSPMAIDVTEIFRDYHGYLARGLIPETLPKIEPFLFPTLTETRSVKESKAINKLKKPAIIMAGSGMCVGGRIKHHLLHNIERSESTILFVGYQARGTLGRHLLENPSRVRILGHYHPVRARIERIDGFSSHADRDGLLDWRGGFRDFPGKLFIVHGEEESSRALAESIRKQYPGEVIVPKYLEKYRV